MCTTKHANCVHYTVVLLQSHSGPVANLISNSLWRFRREKRAHIMDGQIIIHSPSPSLLPLSPLPLSSLSLSLGSRSRTLVQPVGTMPCSLMSTPYSVTDSILKLKHCSNIIPCCDSVTVLSVVLISQWESIMCTTKHANSMATLQTVFIIL